MSIEDKIELFRNVIYKDIEESASESKIKATESFEQEKSRLLAEVEAKRNRIIEEAAKKAEREKQMLIAKAKANIHHQILDKKQQFIKETIELLVREAKSFVAEESYKEYLLKSLEKAENAFEDSESVKLYFTKGDMEALGEFINQRISSGKLKGRCLLQETGQNIIGGFYAEDSKQEMQVDYTLKSLIEENRELIGSNVSNRLDEVQGNGY
ncbi:MAG TPA: V-type ATP synthase subunit E [Clostridia bacterium]|nr:V-type ATP synthase subunit E [Clostridia bacterium]